jgi:hypothetical protein
MESWMPGSTLIELERAELAARERRLAAATEAERRIATAVAEAERIRGGIAAAISSAIDARRLAHQAECAAAVAVIEAELETGGSAAAGDATVTPGGQPGPEAHDSGSDRFLEPAIEWIVASVLDERGD